jgi:sphingolipid delta-4 desaturase
MSSIFTVLKGQDALEASRNLGYKWATNGEPHAIRRREILNKYGDQVRKLYGHDTKTAKIVFLVVVSQFIVARLVANFSWPAIAVLSYVVSGTLNQNLFCAQHEISHCLAFKKPQHNHWLALFANTCLVVPMAVKFREYHHDHHLFLGVDGGDVDLPTVFESTHIRGLLMKIMYGLVYLVTYGVRPLIVRPKAAHMGDIVNWILVMGVNAAILYFWGIKSLVYLFAGSILGGGIHPLAGHLISEHYQFEPGQETYSYYGPLNALGYNVGYHNEHHDFPQIPQTRLHKLRDIAPEYYTNMYSHSSWCWVLYKFLTLPSMGPWSRMHRLSRQGTKEGNEQFISGNCRYGTNLEEDTSSDNGSDAGSTSEQVAPSPERPLHRKEDSAFGLTDRAKKAA